MQNTFNFKLLKNLKAITINKIQIFKHDILKFSNAKGNYF